MYGLVQETLEPIYQETWQNGFAKSPANNF